jgi:negative regulator of flagellin synthesis FlgM
MNISKLSQQLQALANEQTQGTANKANTKAGTNAAAVAPTEKSSTSEVKLSPLSEKLKALSSEFSANASFDAEKVAALKAQIANGTFKVDANAVADKMIAEAKEIAGKKN